MAKKDPSKDLDYAAREYELSDILAKLQQPGMQVDEAIKLYEQGLKLVSELEAYLAAAENKIQKLKLSAQSSAEAASLAPQKGT